MTLEDQSTETLELLGQLADHATHAEEQVARATHDLEEQRARVAEVHHQLEGAFDHAAAESETAAHRVEQSVLHLVGALDGLRAKIGSATGRVHGSVERVSRAIAELAQVADRLESDLVAKGHAAEAAQEALRGALVHGVETVGAAGERYATYLTGDVAERVRAARAGVHEWEARLQASLSERALEQLQSHVSTFTAQLEEAGGRLQSVVDERRESLAQQTADIVEQATDRVSGEVEGLVAAAQNAGERIGDAVTAIEAAIHGVSAAATAVEAGTAATTTGVDAALGVLRELQELFDRF